MIAFLNDKDFILQSLNKSSPNIESASAYVLFVKAKWCGHCVRYFPQFEQEQLKYPKVQFLVLESTDNERMLNQWAQLASPVFEIKGFPTLVLYNDKGMPVKLIENRHDLGSVLN